MSIQLNRLGRLELNFQETTSPPAQTFPAPKAVSNFLFRYHVNSATDEITGRNIIYHRTNLDGTIDEVERTYDCCQRGGYWLGRWGFFGWGGPLVQPIPPHDTPEVTNYIMGCETKCKNYKPGNVNVHRCGALLREQRLPSPPPPKPSINDEIAQLKTQIAEQNQQQSALLQQLAQKDANIVQLRHQLEALQQNQQTTQALLTTLLDRLNQY